MHSCVVLLQNFETLAKILYHVCRYPFINRPKIRHQNKPFAKTLKTKSYLFVIEFIWSMKFPLKALTIQSNLKCNAPQPLCRICMIFVLFFCLVFLEQGTTSKAMHLCQNASHMQEIELENPWFSFTVPS